MRRHAVTLTLATALAASAATVPAGASLVPQKGIRDVTLGMSIKKVRSVLGEPQKMKTGSNDFGPYTQLVYIKLTVTFQGNAGVTNLDTNDPTERTTAGVGIGSRSQDVAAKVPGAKCATQAGYIHCYVGSWKPGKTVTDFALRNGKVVRIDVGIVID